MSRKLCRKLDYSVFSDLDSGKAENDALKDSSKARSKRNAGVIGIFRQYAERRAKLVGIALLEDLEGSLRITETGVKHCDDGIAHCRAVRIDTVEVVIDVTDDLFRICHDSKRIC